jgi:hypothetical protein
MRSLSSLDLSILVENMERTAGLLGNGIPSATTKDVLEA